jgi:hypothetical protein
VEDEPANPLFEVNISDSAFSHESLPFLPTQPTYGNIFETFPIKLRSMMDHFNSGTLQNGDTFRRTFNEQGATLIIAKSMAVQEAQTSPGKLW